MEKLALIYKQISSLDSCVDDDVRRELVSAVDTLRRASNIPGTFVSLSRFLEGPSGFLGRIAKAAGLQLRHNLLEQQIEQLRQQGVIPPELASDLHWVRVRASRARHRSESLEITADDAENAISYVLRLVKWYYCDFDNGPKLRTIYSVNFEKSVHKFELLDVWLEQEECVKRFVGRDRQLERLRQWLWESDQGRYLLVLGDLGVGKSSLLARFAHELGAGERGEKRSSYVLCLLHMMQSCGDPLGLLRFLLFQIDRVTGGRLGEEDYQGDVDTLRNTLLRLLLESSNYFKRVVVIIDAIDELNNIDLTISGKEGLLDFLPSCLPQRVCFILSCRSNSTVVKYIKNKIYNIKEYRLEPFSKVETHAFLLQRLGELNASQILGRVSVDELQRLTEGNPLCLEYVTRALRDSMGVQEHEVDKLIGNMGDLFEIMYHEAIGLKKIRNLRRKPKEQILRENLANCLAVAREPISTPLLRDLLRYLLPKKQVSLADVRRLLLQMSDYIREYEGERFRLFHQGLIDYILTQVLATDEKAHLHYVYAQVLNRSSSYYSEYRLRHLTAHLLACAHLYDQEGMHSKANAVLEQLRMLLTNPEFINQRISAKMVYELLQDYRKFSLVSNACEQVSLWYQFLDKNVHILSHFPELTYQQMVNDGLEIFKNSNKIDYEENCRTKIKYLLRIVNRTQASPFVRTLRVPTAAWTLATLSDEQILVGTNSGEIYLWNTKENTSAELIGSHHNAVWAISVIDETRFASCGDDCTISIWDVSTRTLLSDLRKHSNWVRALVLLNPDTMISGDLDGVLRFWNPQTGEERFSPIFHSAPVICLARLDEKQFIVGDASGVVSIWKVGDIRPSASRQNHTGRVRSVLLHDNRLVISGGGDGTVCAWDYRTGEVVWRVHTEGGCVRTMCILPTKQVVVGCDDGRTYLIESGKIKHKLSGSHTGSVCSVVSNREGELISCGDDKRIRVWDKEAACRAERISSHKDWVWTITKLRDYIVTSGDDGLVCIWKRNSGYLSTFIDTQLKNLRFASKLSNDSILFGCSEKVFFILKFVEGNWSYEFFQWLEDCTPQCMATMPDGKHIIIGCTDGRVLLWNSTNRKICKIWNTPIDTVLSVTALSKETIVATGMDSNIVLISNPDNTIRVLQGRTLGIRAVARLDSNLFVLGSRDGILSIWSGEEGRCLQTIEGHDGSIRSIAILPEGKIASGSWDHTLRVWDLATGELLALFPADSAVLCCTALSKTRIACGTASGMIYLLNLEQV